MAFKFVVLCSLLAMANAGVIAPVTTTTFAAAPAIAVAHHNVAIANPAIDAVASTHQNVVRSFGGTVSTYSKAVDTPYSSVRKVDTRISNNVYTPALAKTVSYAAPALSKTIVAPVPTAAVYTHAAAPVVYSHAAPVAVAPAAVVKQAIAYSPAVNVAHITFDGFGTHWGY